MAEYRYLDVVKLGIDAGRARLPPIQESAVQELGDILSHEVMRSDWTAIGGAPLHVSGKNLESYIDYLISTRPHWLVPEIQVEATEMWLNPTLTAQGKRWREINAVLNDTEATNEAMAKEAAKYGCTVGSTTPGTKPGTRPAADKKARKDNPYSPCSRGGEQARMEKIIAICKSSASLAASLAKSAGCRIDGSLIPKH